MSVILIGLVNDLAYAALDDFSFSAGVASWYNTYNPISRIEGMDTPHSSFSLMSGPTLSAQYKNMNLDITYLLSTSDYEIMSPNTAVSTHHANANSAANRTDLDIVFGYMLTPELSLNVGYEGIFVDDSVTLVSKVTTTNGRRVESYNLGTLGIGGRILVWPKVMWISNGNAIFGSFHNEVSYPANYKPLNEPNYNAPGRCQASCHFAF